MASNLTSLLLDKAHERLGEDIDQAIRDSGYDTETVRAHVLKMHEDTGLTGALFSAPAWTMLGVALGIELGRLRSDPSFPLARELDQAGPCISPLHDEVDCIAAGLTPKKMCDPCRTKVQAA